MIISRRSFSLALAHSLILGGSTEIFGQVTSLSDGEPDIIPPLPAEFQMLANEMPRNAGAMAADQQTGSGKPSDHQNAIASMIMAGAPMATTPYEVASYLHSVALGKFGVDRQGYMRAWPVSAPANPVILEFFRKTSTTPSGDATAWCAAFLNWCMVRAYEGRKDASRLYAPTRSASSGSFRRWGRAISLSPDYSWSQPPQQGDIVVFQQTLASGRAHPTQGHVAFVDAIEGQYIRALGGNQFEGKPPIHCINSKRIRILTLADAAKRKAELIEAGKDRTVLAIHSIRTARSLHEKLLS